MTKIDFAKALGVCDDFVGRRIASGEIPAKKIYKGANYIWDIDPSLVPVWQEKVKNKDRGPVVAPVKIDKREYKSKDTPLRQATRKLNEVSEKTGKHLSYGEAVALGII